MIVGETLPEAWQLSLELFDEPSMLNRFESDRGPCVERENVLISVRRPSTEPTVASAYPQVFQPLIDGVAAAFTGALASSQSTLRQRLYAWPRRGADADGRPEPLDQVELIRRNLRESPDSRFTLAGFWDPDIDPFLPNPVSPLYASFRMRGGALNATLSARSVDAWMGAFPMFVGFLALHRSLAKSAQCEVGNLTIFVLSYHLYEIDLPIAKALVHE